MSSPLSAKINPIYHLNVPPEAVSLSVARKCIVIWQGNLEYRSPWNYLISLYAGNEKKKIYLGPS